MRENEKIETIPGICSRTFYLFQSFHFFFKVFIFFEIFIFFQSFHFFKTFIFLNFSFFSKFSFVSKFSFFQNIKFFSKFSFFFEMFNFSKLSFSLPQGRNDSSKLFCLHVPARHTSTTFLTATIIVTTLPPYKIHFITSVTLTPFF